MTATTKTPGAPGRTRRRPLRFSSLESLGFTDTSSVWSDSEPAPHIRRRPRHLAAGTQPEILADWRPEDFGPQLARGNVRWGLVTTLLTLVAVVTVLGFWLYQRPAARAEASVVAVSERAEALAAALPTLEEFNTTLLEADSSDGASPLFQVEREARALFQAGAELGNDQFGMRSATSEAAGSAIEGVRLASEAHAYRFAVLRLLATPELETDHSLIELDEAARMFGDWQLAFNETRTALPEGVLPEVSDQLDLLSADLVSIMGRYVDALRLDDGAEARGVLADLTRRLDKIDGQLTRSLQDIQARVGARVGEAWAALRELRGD